MDGRDEPGEGEEVVDLLVDDVELNVQVIPALRSGRNGMEWDGMERDGGVCGGEE